jgi:hypothetical protein
MNRMSRRQLSLFNTVHLWVQEKILSMRPCNSITEKSEKSLTLSYPEIPGIGSVILFVLKSDITAKYLSSIQVSLRLAITRNTSTDYHLSLRPLPTEEIRTNAREVQILEWPPPVLALMTLLLRSSMKSNSAELKQNILLTRLLMEQS